MQWDYTELFYALADGRWTVGLNQFTAAGVAGSFPYEREGEAAKAEAIAEYHRQILQLGGEGWEMISATPYQHGGDTVAWHLWFKRPRV